MAKEIIRPGFCSFCDKDLEFGNGKLSRYTCGVGCSECIAAYNASKKVPRRSQKPCHSAEELILMLGLGIAKE